MNNTLPLHLWLLEVNQEAYRRAGSAQIIETLRHMLVRKPFSTLQLDHQRVLNNNIREVFTNVQALILHWERTLSNRSNAAQCKFAKKRAFIDLLEEPGAQTIRDLKNSAQDLLRNQIRNIGVHQRSSAAKTTMCALQPTSLKATKRTQLQ